MSDDSILKTFWRNSFGSDELEHYTAEYTWLANQMAHAMMAFCLAACWALFVFNLKRRFKSEDDELAALQKQLAAEQASGAPTVAATQDRVNALAARIAARGWFTRWVNKTRVDLLMSWPFIFLFLKEVLDIVSDAIRFSGGPLPQRYFNPVLDSGTDLLFWYSGLFLALFVASFYFDAQRYRLPAALVGFVVCLVAGYFGVGTFWLNQKKTFDRSGLPLNYTRLVYLTTEWSDPQKTPKHPFLEERKDAQHAILGRIQATAAGDAGTRPEHVVLFGGSPEDRSKLAVSLACEFAFRLRFDERTQADDLQRRKVVYTTAVKALAYPEALIKETSRTHLRCVVIDDLDITLDPPIDLLIAASAEFPELKKYYGHSTLQKIALAAEHPGLTPEVKAKIRKPVAGPPKGGLESSLAYRIDLTGLTHEELAQLKAPVTDTLRPREQQDEARRLRVYQALRAALATKDSPISSIWVLSNTGVKRKNPTDPDPQAENREKWMYLIAYLTGVSRDKLEADRIEFTPLVMEDLP